MTEPAPEYDELVERVRVWAQGRDDLHAVLIVGSRAHLDRPADAHSDLDLILFTTQPEAYAADPAWLNVLGEIWLAHLDAVGQHDREWQAVFAGGIKADFLLSGVSPTAAPNLPALIAGFRYPQVLRRGYQVLHSQDGGRGAAAPAVEKAKADALPNEETFVAAVKGMLMDTTRAVRLLRHGDLWRAKYSCDCELKLRLLTMLEWHAQAVYGPERDTWYEGRFMEEWADPEYLAALPTTFARFDLTDVRRALSATLNLYRQLAQTTAARLNFRYPEASDGAISGWISEQLE